jgi:chitodextrinase
MFAGGKRKARARWLQRAVCLVAGLLLAEHSAQARLPVCNGATGQNAITTASISLYTSAQLNQSVTLSGTAESDAVGVLVKVNGALSFSTTLSGSSSEQRWSVVVDATSMASFPDGPVVAAATVLLPGNDTADAGSLTITKNVTPPGVVQNLVATGGTGQVALTWTNPSDSDFAVVRLLQSTSAFATTPTPGGSQSLAYEGSATSATISGLLASTTYNFTAFARDSAGNWSSGRTATATTASTPPPPPPPTDVNFSDNFDACTSSSDLGPKWTTAGIWYCRAGKARGESGPTVAIANTAAIANTDVTARIQLTSTKGNAGLAARIASGSYYAASMLASGSVQVVRVNGSTTTVLGEVKTTIKIEPNSQRLRMKVTGTTTVQIDVWLDSKAILTVQDTTAQRLQSGQSGLYSATSTRTQYDDFSVVSP